MESPSENPPGYTGLIARLRWLLESPATDDRWTWYSGEYVRLAADALEAQERIIDGLRVENEMLLTANEAQGRRLAEAKALLRECADEIVAQFDPHDAVAFRDRIDAFLGKRS